MAGLPDLFSPTPTPAAPHGPVLPVWSVIPNLDNASRSGSEDGVEISEPEEDQLIHESYEPASKRQKLSKNAASPGKVASGSGVALSTQGPLFRQGKSRDQGGPEELAKVLNAHFNAADPLATPSPSGGSKPISVSEGTEKSIWVRPQLGFDALPFGSLPQTPSRVGPSSLRRFPTTPIRSLVQSPNTLFSSPLRSGSHARSPTRRRRSLRPQTQHARLAVPVLPIKKTTVVKEEPEEDEGYEPNQDELEAWFDADVAPVKIVGRAKLDPETELRVQFMNSRHAREAARKVLAQLPQKETIDHPPAIGRNEIPRSEKLEEALVEIFGEGARYSGWAPPTKRRPPGKRLASEDPILLGSSSADEEGSNISEAANDATGHGDSRESSTDELHLFTPVSSSNKLPCSNITTEIDDPFFVPPTASPFPPNLPYEEEEEGQSHQFGTRTRSPHGLFYTPFETGDREQDQDVDIVLPASTTRLSEPSSSAPLPIILKTASASPQSIVRESSIEPGFEIISPEVTEGGPPRSSFPLVVPEPTHRIFTQVFDFGPPKNIFSDINGVNQPLFSNDVHTSPFAGFSNKEPSRLATAARDKPADPSPLPVVAPSPPTDESAGDSVVMHDASDSVDPPPRSIGTPLSTNAQDLDPLGDADNTPTQETAKHVHEYVVQPPPRRKMSYQATTFRSALFTPPPSEPQSHSRPHSSSPQLDSAQSTSSKSLADAPSSQEGGADGASPPSSPSVGDMVASSEPDDSSVLEAAMILESPEPVVITDELAVETSRADEGSASVLRHKVTVKGIWPSLTEEFVNQVLIGEFDPSLFYYLAEDLETASVYLAASDDEEQVSDDEDVWANADVESEDEQVVISAPRADAMESISTHERPRKSPRKTMSEVDPPSSSNPLSALSRMTQLGKRKREISSDEEEQGPAEASLDDLIDPPRHLAGKIEPWKAALLSLVRGKKRLSPATLLSLKAILGEIFANREHIKASSPLARVVYDLSKLLSSEIPDNDSIGLRPLAYKSVRSWGDTFSKRP